MNLKVFASMGIVVDPHVTVLTNKILLFQPELGTETLVLRGSLLQLNQMLLDCFKQSASGELCVDLLKMKSSVVS